MFPGARLRRCPEFGCVLACPCARGLAVCLCARAPVPREETYLRKGEISFKKRESLLETKPDRLSRPLTASSLGILLLDMSLF